MEFIGTLQTSRFCVKVWLADHAAPTPVPKAMAESEADSEVQSIQGAEHGIPVSPNPAK